MGTILMEALISSTTATSSPGPTRATPQQAPANHNVPLSTERGNFSFASPTMEAPANSAATASPSPAQQEIPVVDIPDDDYALDPVHQIMDLLNFTVVPKKPVSILDAPVPPGDMIPRSHYLEEKQALHELIKTHRRDVLKAQVDKLNEVMKSQNTEKKMQRVVKIIADLHHLYGQFLQSLVLLMKKAQGQDGQVLLTLGPFQDVQEVDKLLVMLSGLSNHFQNDFENLSKTKQVLTEVTGYLTDKATKSVLTSPTGDESVSPMETEPVDQGSMFSSEASCLLTPEDESVPTITTVDTDNGNQNATSINTETTNESLGTQAILLASPSQVTPTADEGSTSVFIPVPDPDKPQLGNGKLLYTLVEYPERLNLINKKHGFDLTRSQGGNTWYCLCNREFSSLSLIKYHVRYFSAKWKFLCTLCSRKYPGLNFLKLHMLRTHKIMYVGTNSCNYCAKSFQTASELLRHLKNVHKKKLPADVDHLTEAHSGESQPAENISSVSATATAGSTASSSAASTTPSSDPKSVLVVNGTRCACGMELGTKEGLIAHIRAEVETYGQNFKCNLCAENFNHSCNLKSHFREKHGLEYRDYQERQFGCSCCELMFESYEDLETHTVSTHQMNQDPPAQENDPLCINDNDTIENTDENTITFHVDTSGRWDDSAGASSIDPPMVTLED